MSNPTAIDRDHPAAVSPRLTRRRLFQATAATALAGWAGTALAEEGTPEEPVVKKGRVRQSVMGWCFNPMPTEQLAKHAKAIGLVGIEGIDASRYPAVRQLGLQISLVGSHGFRTGPFSRENDEQGAKNCVECWKQVIPYAEEKGVNLCLEHLNTRDDSHPMKGHPGYFGDDVDFCVELIRRVDSPRMKLLFDIYHVQIMNGDVIRRIRQYKDVVSHYHTAGVPGRGELDDTQEINYPAVIKAILETGYEGYVTHEFIPTWDDPISGLRHAARLCDV